MAFLNQLAPVILLAFVIILACGSEKTTQKKDDFNLESLKPMGSLQPLERREIALLELSLQVPRGYSGFIVNQKSTRPTKGLRAQFEGMFLNSASNIAITISRLIYETSSPRGPLITAYLEAIKNHPSNQNFQIRATNVPYRDFVIHTCQFVRDGAIDLRAIYQTSTGLDYQIDYVIPLELYNPDTLKWVRRSSISLAVDESATF